MRAIDGRWVGQTGAYHVRTTDRGPIAVPEENIFDVTAGARVLTFADERDFRTWVWTVGWRQQAPAAERTARCDVCGSRGPEGSECEPCGTERLTVTV